MSDYKTRATMISKIQNKHDDSAWEEFTLWYSPYIYAIVHKSAVDKIFVEDLVQDILLSVWKSIGNFEYNPEKSMFRTWLGRVCRNKIIDFLRTSKTHKHQHETLDEELRLIDSDLEESVEREWRIYIAQKAFEAIKEQFSEKVFECYELFQKGHSAEEIALKLEITEKSIYVYNKRVKDAMRRQVVILTQLLA